jgi:hypothetical protein
MDKFYMVVANPQQNSCEIISSILLGHEDGRYSLQWMVFGIVM